MKIPGACYGKRYTLQFGTSGFFNTTQHWPWDDKLTVNKRQFQIPMVSLACFPHEKNRISMENPFRPSRPSHPRLVHPLSGWGFLMHEVSTAAFSNYHLSIPILFHLWELDPI